MTLSGVSPDGKLVEAIEIGKNSFFIGVQFHPEFKSRPDKAHPLFKGFIEKSLQHKSKRSKK
jgi:CTP synthase